MKPAAAPGDRVMVGVLLQRGRIIRGRNNPRSDEGRYWGGLTADSPQALTNINEAIRSEAPAF
jgi:hypothetical protein